MDQGTTTNENIFQRMCGAMCSSVLGVLLIPLCMVLVFWNENNLLINEATAELVHDAKVYTLCTPSSAADGDLVLVSCDLYTPDIADTLPDTLAPFLPHFSGASLSWSTEIYQWIESQTQSCVKTNSGGKSCTTTYSYRADWSSSVVDSSQFANNQRYDNGHTDFPYNLAIDGSNNAPQYSVVMSQHGAPTGGFALDDVMVDYLPSVDLGDRLRVYSGNQSDQWGGAGELSPAMLHPRGGYLQTATGTPRIGDLRIHITGRTAQEATACGVQQRLEDAQSQYTFVPLPPQKFGFFGKRTKPLERLQAEKVSADDFIAAYHAENQNSAWLIRIIALVIMAVAFNMVLSPLSVAADSLMMLNYCTCGLGSVLDGAAQCVIATAAFLSALVLTTLTIAVAWFAARPALSLSAVAVTVVLYVAFMKMQKKKGARGMPYVSMAA